MRINWHKHLAGFLLTVLFIAFTISGVTLINTVYTLTPFTIYGQPVTIQINIGVALLLLALITLVFLLKAKE